MGGALKADADALRGLSRSLTGVGDGIGGIAAPPPATMPGSSIQGASTSAADAVNAAHNTMAARIHAMASAAETNADNYEAADAAFSAQLQQYQAGQP